MALARVLLTGGLLVRKAGLGSCLRPDYFSSISPRRREICVESERIQETAEQR
jgi:hypothetical protein